MTYVDQLQMQVSDMSLQARYEEGILHPTSNMQ